MYVFGVSLISTCSYFLSRWESPHLSLIRFFPAPSVTPSAAPQSLFPEAPSPAQIQMTSLLKEQNHVGELGLSPSLFPRVITNLGIAIRIIRPRRLSTWQSGFCCNVLLRPPSQKPHQALQAPPPGGFPTALFCPVSVLHLTPRIPPSFKVPALLARAPLSAGAPHLLLCLAGPP